MQRQIIKNNIPDTIKCFACGDAAATCRLALTDCGVTVTICVCHHCAAMKNHELYSMFCRACSPSDFR